MVENASPWDDQNAADWLCTFEAWKLMVGFVRRTLERDPRSCPHEIRAAASFVIMFCREGTWPNFVDPIEGAMILDLARRQLSVVRQMYALEGRSNKKLMANRNFKMLLKSLEEEIRILDSRVSDEDVTMANQPPVTWGEFLGKRTARRNELDN
jgi:hypothetical protein